MPAKASNWNALLANLVGAASALLRPSVDVIRRYLPVGLKLHANDTLIPMLAPGSGKTRTARCGHMCLKTGPPATLRLRPSGLRTRRAARVFIRKPTWPAAAACCRPMPTPASMRSMSTAPYRKWHAGRTRAGSSTIVRGQAVGHHHRGAAPDRRTVRD